MTIEINDIVSCRRKGWWKVVDAESSSLRGHRKYCKVKLVLSSKGVVPKKEITANVPHYSISKVSQELIDSFRASDDLKWDNLERILNPEVYAEKDSKEADSRGDLILSKLGPPPSLLEDTSK